MVDKRTDIWAFGCVLYEMLVGRSTFGRNTLSDTIVAILDRDPDWTALPTDTPASVRTLIRRCLERDPKRRLRDIGDARADFMARSFRRRTCPRGHICIRCGDEQTCAS